MGMRFGATRATRGRERSPPPQPPGPPSDPTLPTPPGEPPPDDPTDPGPPGLPRPPDEGPDNDRDEGDNGKGKDEDEDQGQEPPGQDIGEHKPIGDMTADEMRDFLEGLPEPDQDLSEGEKRRVKDRLKELGTNIWRKFKTGDPKDPEFWKDIADELDQYGGENPEDWDQVFERVGGEGIRQVLENVFGIPIKEIKDTSELIREIREGRWKEAINDGLNVATDLLIRSFFRAAGFAGLEASLAAAPFAFLAVGLAAVPKDFWENLGPQLKHSFSSAWKRLKSLTQEDFGAPGGAAPDVPNNPVDPPEGEPNAGQILIREIEDFFGWLFGGDESIEDHNLQTYEQKKANAEFMVEHNRQYSDLTDLEKKQMGLWVKEAKGREDLDLVRNNPDFFPDSWFAQRG